MFNRFDRRHRAATLAALSTLSLGACTPPADAPAKLPPECQQLADDYAAMNAASSMVTESQALLQQGVLDAIEVAGYATTSFRDDMLLVVSKTEVPVNGPNGGTTTAYNPINMGMGRENGVTYPLYLALRLTDAANGTRADGEPSYGLVVVSDMSTIFGQTDDGRLTSFATTDRQLTEAQMRALPEALRNFDRNILVDRGITLAKLREQRVPIINGQNQVVSHRLDAIEAAQRSDPSGAQRCEYIIFPR